jgi:hypothetical protein
MLRLSPQAVGPAHCDCYPNSPELNEALEVAPPAIERCVERVSRLYWQGVDLIGAYIRRWLQWARGGLRALGAGLSEPALAPSAPAAQCRERPSGKTCRLDPRGDLVRQDVVRTGRTRQPTSGVSPILVWRSRSDLRPRLAPRLFSARESLGVNAAPRKPPDVVSRFLAPARRNARTFVSAEEGVTKIYGAD